MLHVHVKIHSDPALPKKREAEIEEATGSYFKRQRQASAGNFRNTVKIYTIHIYGIPAIGSYDKYMLLFLTFKSGKLYFGVIFLPQKINFNGLVYLCRYEHQERLKFYLRVIC